MLENKLGITNASELFEAEEKITKKKALELFENGMLNTLETGKFSSLKAIHKYLFDEIYFFAGEVRTVRQLPFCTFALFGRQRLNISIKCRSLPLMKLLKNMWR